MNKRRISEIWIYPIKSLAGIRLQKAMVMQKGLEYDRRWMLVDQEGRFLTQREHPTMALFTLTLDNSNLTVTSQLPVASMQSSFITIDLKEAISGDLTSVQIWDDQVEAAEVKPEYSAWFSQQLGIPCKLVFFPEDKRRDANPDYAKNNEQVSLADGYPFLIIGQTSLDDLNKKLEQPVSMRRFRPNFVFTDGLPYEEDTWRDFKIGQVSFRGIKPCGRCLLITVNPETGEMGVEPLKTLASYRKQGGKVYFGENLLARTYGEVCEGDDVEIMDFKTPRI
jgi:uncharacterized protein YcbX